MNKQDYQKALSYLQKGDWQSAHNIVQSENTNIACLIHALVHRMEGDDFNARYWYRQAQENFPNNSLNEELSRLSNFVADW